MCLLIRTVISEKVANVQSTFDVGDFKHPDKVESKRIKDNSNQNKLIIGCEKPYDKKTSSDEIYVDEKGVYHYVVPHCSHCKSTNVTKHDTNLTPVYSKDGEKEYVEVKRYNCKSCGKGSQVEFKDEFKKHSGLPVKLDGIIEKLNSLHWISLRDKVKIVKTTLGLPISHEYVRKAQLVTDELYWRNENIMAPDYVNYDVQWVPIDSGWSYFHMLIDNKTKKIIAVQLKRFLKKSFIFGLKLL